MADDTKTTTMDYYERTNNNESISRFNI